MNATRRSMLALLAGVAIGVAGVEALQAQQAKAPPAYVISNIDVTDPAGYQPFVEAFPATLVPYRAHFLARGGKTQSFAGEAPKRVAIIAFNNMEDAVNWRNSDALQKIMPMREGKATYLMNFAVEGVSEAQEPAVGTSTPPAK